MADIVTSQDAVDLQNKSIDLIGKEGKLFLIQMIFFCRVLQIIKENPLLFIFHLKIRQRDYERIINCTWP